MKTKIRNRLQSQIQVRIDAKTKEEAKKVLENYGLDISSAIRVLFKQIVYTKSLPLDLRIVKANLKHIRKSS